jgi:hypothetical protein
MQPIAKNASVDLQGSSRPQAVINEKPDLILLWALHNRKLGVEMGGREERARV